MELHQRLNRIVCGRPAEEQSNVLAAQRVGARSALRLYSNVC
jgi:hypothetical protein